MIVIPQCEGPRDMLTFRLSKYTIAEANSHLEIANGPISMLPYSDLSAVENL